MIFRYSRYNFYFCIEISVYFKVTFEEEDEFDLTQVNEPEMPVDSRDGLGGNNNENSFNCEYCNYKALTTTHVRSHVVREHLRNIVYVCSLCPYECKWNSEYYSHMQTHFSVKFESI